MKLFIHYCSKTMLIIAILIVFIPSVDLVPIEDSLKSGFPSVRASNNHLTLTDNTQPTDPNSITDLQKTFNQLQSNFTDLLRLFEQYKRDATSQATALQTRIKELENNITSVAANSPQKIQVGFSASLKTKQQHVKLGTKVKFDNVYHQSGNAYNEQTGVFTAPVNGLYLFSIFCHSSDAKTLVMSAKVDGLSRTVCVSEPAFAGEDDTGGNMFVSTLNKGQQVWVETYEVADVSIYPSFTTFSGVLIQGE